MKIIEYTKLYIKYAIKDTLMHLILLSYSINAKLRVRFGQVYMHSLAVNKCIQKIVYIFNYFPIKNITTITKQVSSNRTNYGSQENLDTQKRVQYKNR